MEKKAPVTSKEKRDATLKSYDDLKKNIRRILDTNIEFQNNSPDGNLGLECELAFLEFMRENENLKNIIYKNRENMKEE